MKKLLTCVSLAVLTAAPALAQPGEQQLLLMDLPTAATLERGSFAIDLRMFGNGGLLTGLTIGITPRFTIGLSYGGENFIGSGSVDWNSQPGIQARARLIDESLVMPAITLGFDSQGFGPYNDEFKRYQIKSRGIFAVASKNYRVFHNLGLHGGLNYSLETDDDDKDLNLFFGASLSFNREFHFLFEYDLARNDNNNPNQFGSGDGYMNLGLLWTLSERFYLQFYFKDILKNGLPDSSREFKIGYYEYF